MGISTYLTMTVEVWRRSAGIENDYGERQDTWAKIADIASIIQPSDGKVAREEGGQMITSTHTLFCLVGTNIRAGDKVKYDGKFYNVMFVGDAAGRHHHYEVPLKVDE